MTNSTALGHQRLQDLQLLTLVLSGELYLLCIINSFPLLFNVLGQKECHSCCYKCYHRTKIQYKVKVQRPPLPYTETLYKFKYVSIKRKLYHSIHIHTISIYFYNHPPFPVLQAKARAPARGPKVRATATVVWPKPFTEPRVSG